MSFGRYRQEQNEERSQEDHAVIVAVSCRRSAYAVWSIERHTGLPFEKGFLARDPDGHAVEVVQ